VRRLENEVRGNRKSAYQGRYWLEADHIEYVDDTGFTADVISVTGSFITPE
jgi:hypothetical protein